METETGSSKDRRKVEQIKETLSKDEIYEDRGASEGAMEELKLDASPGTESEVVKVSRETSNESGKKLKARQKKEKKRQGAKQKKHAVVETEKVSDREIPEITVITASGEAEPDAVSSIRTQDEDVQITIDTATPDIVAAIKLETETGSAKDRRIVEQIKETLSKDETIEERKAVEVAREESHSERSRSYETKLEHVKIGVEEERHDVVTGDHKELNKPDQDTFRSIETEVKNVSIRTESIGPDATNSLENEAEAADNFNTTAEKSIKAAFSSEESYKDNEAVNAAVDGPNQNTPSGLETHPQIVEVPILGNIVTQKPEHDTVKMSSAQAENVNVTAESACSDSTPSLEIEAESETVKTTNEEIFYDTFNSEKTHTDGGTAEVAMEELKLDASSGTESQVVIVGRETSKESGKKLKARQKKEEKKRQEAKQKKHAEQETEKVADREIPEITVITASEEAEPDAVSSIRTHDEDVQITIDTANPDIDAAIKMVTETGSAKDRRIVEQIKETLSKDEVYKDRRVVEVAIEEPHSERSSSIELERVNVRVEEEKQDVVTGDDKQLENSNQDKFNSIKAEAENVSMRIQDFGPDATISLEKEADTLNTTVEKPRNNAFSSETTRVDDEAVNALDDPNPDKPSGLETQLQIVDFTGIGNIVTQKPERNRVKMISAQPETVKVTAESTSPDSVPSLEIEAETERATTTNEEIINGTFYSEKSYIGGGAVEDAMEELSLNTSSDTESQVVKVSRETSNEIGKKLKARQKKEGKKSQGAKQKEHFETPIEKVSDMENLDRTALGASRITKGSTGNNIIRQDEVVDNVEMAIDAPNPGTDNSLELEYETASKRRIGKQIKESIDERKDVEVEIEESHSERSSSKETELEYSKVRVEVEKHDVVIGLDKEIEKSMQDIVDSIKTKVENVSIRNEAFGPGVTVSLKTEAEEADTGYATVQKSTKDAYFSEETKVDGEAVDVAMEEQYPETPMGLEAQLQTAEVTTEKPTQDAVTSGDVATETPKQDTGKIITIQAEISEITTESPGNCLEIEVETDTEKAATEEIITNAFGSEKFHLHGEAIVEAMEELKLNFSPGTDVQVETDTRKGFSEGRRESKRKEKKKEKKSQQGKEAEHVKVVEKKPNRNADADKEIPTKAMEIVEEEPEQDIVNSVKTQQVVKTEKDIQCSNRAISIDIESQTDTVKERIAKLLKGTVSDDEPYVDRDDVEVKIEEPYSEAASSLERNVQTAKVTVEETKQDEVTSDNIAMEEPKRDIFGGIKTQEAIISIGTEAETPGTTTSLEIEAETESFKATGKEIFIDAFSGESIYLHEEAVDSIMEEQNPDMASGLETVEAEIEKSKLGVFTSDNITIEEPEQDTINIIKTKAEIDEITTSSSTLEKALTFGIEAETDPVNTTTEDMIKNAIHLEETCRDGQAVDVTTEVQQDSSSDLETRMAAIIRERAEKSRLRRIKQKQQERETQRTKQTECVDVAKQEQKQNTVTDHEKPTKTIPGVAEELKEVIDETPTEQPKHATVPTQAESSEVTAIDQHTAFTCVENVAENETNGKTPVEQKAVELKDDTALIYRENEAETETNDTTSLEKKLDTVTTPKEEMHAEETVELNYHIAIKSIEMNVETEPFVTTSLEQKEDTIITALQPKKEIDINGETTFELKGETSVPRIEINTEAESNGIISLEQKEDIVTTIQPNEEIDPDEATTVKLNDDIPHTFAENIAETETNYAISLELKEDTFVTTIQSKLETDADRAAAIKLRDAALVSSRETKAEILDISLEQKEDTIVDTIQSKEETDVEEATTLKPKDDDESTVTRIRTEEVDVSTKTLQEALSYADAVKRTQRNNGIDVGRTNSNKIADKTTVRERGHATTEKEEALENTKKDLVGKVKDGKKDTDILKHNREESDNILKSVTGVCTSEEITDDSGQETRRAGYYEKSTYSNNFQVELAGEINATEDSSKSAENDRHEIKTISEAKTRMHYGNIEKQTTIENKSLETVTDVQHRIFRAKKGKKGRNSSKDGAQQHTQAAAAAARNVDITDDMDSAEDAQTVHSDEGKTSTYQTESSALAESEYSDHISSGLSDNYADTQSWDSAGHSLKQYGFRAQKGTAGNRNERQNRKSDTLPSHRNRSFKPSSNEFRKSGAESDSLVRAQSKKEAVATTSVLHQQHKSRQSELHNKKRKSSNYCLLLVLIALLLAVALLFINNLLIFPDLTYPDDSPPV